MIKPAQVSRGARMRPRRQRGANRSGSTTAEERRQASAGSCAPSAPACRALVSAASSAFLSAASACGVAHAASRAAEGSARTADVQALSAAASSSDLTPAAAAAALPLPFAPVRARLAAGPSPGGPMMSPGHSARAATCENEDYSVASEATTDKTDPGVGQAPRGHPRRPPPQTGALRARSSAPPDRVKRAYTVQGAGTKALRREERPKCCPVIPCA